MICLYPLDSWPPPHPRTLAPADTVPCSTFNENYSCFSLFTGVTFFKVMANSELVNAEPLLLGKIELGFSVSLVMTV